jgi:hypothetical protein
MKIRCGRINPSTNNLVDPLIGPNESEISFVCDRPTFHLIDLTAPKKPDLPTESAGHPSPGTRSTTRCRAKLRCITRRTQ